MTFDPGKRENAELTTAEGVVEIGHAHGLWIRRPKWPVLRADIEDPLDRALATQEAVAAMGGVWRTLRDRCVSPPDVMQAARWKLAQLSLAHDLGFQVPQTLVTSDAAKAAAFTQSGPTIIKAVAEGYVRVDDEERRGGTTRIDAAWDLAEVEVAPVLLQREISKVADLRITAIGRELFAVRITAPPDSPLDVRMADADSCRYEVVDLDPQLSAALGTYLDWWGLRFGAFDLAEDAAGMIWFLECNPAGQWAWLEPFTDLDMTRALVDLLLDPMGLGR